MTNQEFEAFLEQNNIPLVDESMSVKTNIHYRIACPLGKHTLDKHTLVLIWSPDSPVRAQCINDFCEMNQHENDSFAFLMSLLHIDVAVSDASVPTARRMSDSPVPDAQQNDRDASVPTVSHSSVSPVPDSSDAPVSEHGYGSDSPVTSGKNGKGSAVTDTDELLRDALTVFIAQATDKEKVTLLDLLRNGLSSIGIQNFISDCFVSCFGSKVEVKEVYRLYEEWCVQNNRYAHTKTDLYQLIERLGYRRRPSNGKKYFTGLSHRDAGVTDVS